MTLLDHLAIAPVLLPLLAGCGLLWIGRETTAGGRALSLASCVALIVLALALTLQAMQGLTVYQLGNWQPPFGIVLVVDRLAALMLLATAVLALPAALYACGGEDRQGTHFHALLQFQLAGLNGAFLTGDLFNLFVCFEILLIASYTLLLHGHGRERSGAGLHYVVLNLVGSTLFLIALGVLYGIAGTLNMADLSVQMAMADGDNVRLLEAAALLLLVVFGLKAALLPIGFWLTRTYSAAPAAAAALFAVMTKVGVYAILRVATLIFGAEAGELAFVLTPWLWPLALLTLAFGAMGALGATRLGALVGYLVLISVGTLLAAVAVGNAEMIAAALYYLLHTTWVSGALFLLTDMLRQRRGASGDQLLAAAPQPALLGALFLVAAVAVIGLPPLSGFTGKLLILQATPLDGRAGWLWALILTGGLSALIALSRAGSTLFWRTSGDTTSGRPLPATALAAVGALLAASALLSAGGAAVTRYADAAAAELLDPRAMVRGVLMSETQPERQEEPLLQPEPPADTTIEELQP